VVTLFEAENGWVIWISCCRPNGLLVCKFEVGEN